VRHVLDPWLTAVDLVVITLAPGPDAIHRGLDPETLTDILWANALPADRLEHVLVRAGADPGSFAAGLFLLPAPDAADPSAGTTATAQRLGDRMIAVSPRLAGWSALAAPGTSPDEPP